MTAGKAVQGRRGKPRRSAEAAPRVEDRLDRLERLIEMMVERNVAPPSNPINATEVRVKVEDDEEREEDQAARAEELRKRREREAVEDAAARDAVDHLIDPRHREIFDWLRHVQGGKRAAQLLKEILRSSLIRERPAYREAQGKGGQSSRNIETLQERLR